MLTLAQSLLQNGRQMADFEGLPVQLLAKTWESDDHPRWPAGTPDNQGGQFAPKNGETGQGTSRNRDDRVAAHSVRALRPWSDLAGQKHLQLVGGSPVWVGPELATDEAFEFYAELETELDSGFDLRPGQYEGVHSFVRP